MSKNFEFCIKTCEPSNFFGWQKEILAHLWNSLFWACRPERAWDLKARPGPGCKFILNIPYVFFTFFASVTGQLLFICRCDGPGFFRQYGISPVWHIVFFDMVTRPRCDVLPSIREREWPSKNAKKDTEKEKENRVSKLKWPLFPRKEKNVFSFYLGPHKLVWCLGVLGLPPQNIEITFV